MATFNKFNIFATDLANAHHNLHTDALLVAVSSTVPTAGMAIKSELTGLIADGNGYQATDINNTVIQTTATANIDVGIDSDKVTWTATGAVPTFRYVVVYNDTCADPVKPLVGWADYGSDVTLSAGESFTVQFATNLMTIT